MIPFKLCFEIQLLPLQRGDAGQPGVRAGGWEVQPEPPARAPHARGGQVGMTRNWLLFHRLILLLLRVVSPSGGGGLIPSLSLGMRNRLLIGLHYTTERNSAPVQYNGIL